MVVVVPLFLSLLLIITIHAITTTNTRLHPRYYNTIALLRAGSSELTKDTIAGVLGLGLVTVEDGKQRLPDLAGLLAGVDGLPDARVLIVAHHGGSLLVVGGEALLEGLGVVIAALDKRLAGDVVGHGLLRGVEDLVIGPARGGVDETARDARHEEGIVDLELDGVLEGLVALAEHLVETLGLGDCAGEAVEDEA